MPWQIVMTGGHFVVDTARKQFPAGGWRPVTAAIAACGIRTAESSALARQRGVPASIGHGVKENSKIRAWLWLDRVLLACALMLALTIAISGAWQRHGRTDDTAAGGAGADDAREAVPQRPVAVPSGASSLVAYGRRAAECGDRSGEWAARGVMRGEWQGAPAAPAVDMESSPGGYTVWCMMPEDTARDAKLRLDGDLLLVGCCADRVGGCTTCLKLRLPGDGSKRIADTSFSNGWLRVRVLTTGEAE